MVTLLNWEVLPGQNLEQNELLDLYDYVRRAFLLRQFMDIEVLDSDIYIRGKIYGNKNFKNGSIVTTSYITTWIVVDGDFSMVKTISGSAYEICLSEASRFQREIFYRMSQAELVVNSCRPINDFIKLCNEK